jgi:hypothetical protein
MATNAAKMGQPRPPHVVEAIRKAQNGRKSNQETRRRMSEAQKRRGVIPLAAGRPWEEWEDDLARTLPAPEVVRRTGRTLTAAYCRRTTLGMPDGRTKEARRL